MVGIFKNGKLWRAPIEGRPHVFTREDKFIWTVFGELIFGASEQAGEEAIKFGF